MARSRPEACSARSSVAVTSSAIIVVHSFQAMMYREKSSHARQIEPAPADHLEVGEVGLPELVGRRGLVLELVRRLHDDVGGAGDQIERLQQAVDRSF